METGEDHECKVLPAPPTGPSVYYSHNIKALTRKYFSDVNLILRQMKNQHIPSDKMRGCKTICSVGDEMNRN